MFIIFFIFRATYIACGERGESWRSARTPCFQPKRVWSSPVFLILTTRCAVLSIYCLIRFFIPSGRWRGKSTLYKARYLITLHSIEYRFNMPFHPKVSNANGNMTADDAEQEAAERNLIRRCVDFHTPAVLDIQNRLYRKACRSHHVRHSSEYLQPHSSHLRLMGLPLSRVSAPIPSELFLTYCAHVTRAKNSSPIMCLSWTPGGRRLLTGNLEG